MRLRSAAGFAASAAVLDQKRLGKQRVECIQVLRGLIRPDYGWRHHPAVKMWAGYEEALVRYALDMCAVWSATGRRVGAGVRTSSLPWRSRI